ncbi:MAG: 30S ribosomal protein S17e [Candidatus Aenigmarchaeota archaeon]|nr:30S ribosomal protein S17e [Candidatus Aenigmarchaeota archaeon]
MGRVKNIAIKTLGDSLLAEHSFTESFEKNKKILGDVKPITSKRIRNILAGYLTTKVKQSKRAPAA